MSGVFIAVGLRAKQGKEEALRRDLIAVVEPSRREAGSLRYDLFVDQGDPGHFFFFEHWASREDQQRHHNHGPHIQAFNRDGAQNVERVEFVYMLAPITS